MFTEAHYKFEQLKRSARSRARQELLDHRLRLCVLRRLLAQKQARKEDRVAEQGGQLQRQLVAQERNHAHQARQHGARQDGIHASWAELRLPLVSDPNKLRGRARLYVPHPCS